jgi:putative transport protein
MLKFLADNPLLVLFMVVGIGYPLGRVRIAGVRLGVAAVLFVGLAFGALDPAIKIPEIIYILGLIIFVYSIGLSSGSVFFEGMRQRGLSASVLVVIGLAFAALLAAAGHYWLGFKQTTTAGMFTGATTNTPALAAVVEMVKSIAPANLLEQFEAEPVVAYSLTYPMGVLGMILAISIMQRLWRVRVETQSNSVTKLVSITVRVTLTHPARVDQLMGTHNWDLVFARWRRGNQPVELVTGETQIQAGDLINLVGVAEVLEHVVPTLGVLNEENLDFDLSQFDKRRVFLSNPQAAGQRLMDLQLSRRFAVLVTRIRRGDVEFVPHGNTRMALGDQLRLVGPPRQLALAAQFLGDSYRSVSEVDLMTLGVGITLGILIGSIPIPFPGGVTFRLGVAGGPLLSALLLGALKRTGPLIWDMPYGANLTLRQIGLVIFLAGIGTRAGYTFVNTLIYGDGVRILLWGTLITVMMTLVVLWLGTKWFKLPFGFLAGLLAGMQTQPAVLGFVNEQYGDELPALGYATVYPLAMVVKIVLAQILVLLK